MSDWDETLEKIKEIVKKGNVDKIVVKRDGEVILNVPVNVGIVGGIVGLSAAPLVTIVAAVTAYGMNCTFEIVKKDGSSETVE